LTRDAEKAIAQAVRSVIGQADEVLVADIGSQDGTIAIAKDLGARVVSCTWNEDFAAARDFTLAQAKGEWILWLNPDEELLADSLTELRECLSRGDALGFYVIVRDIFKEDR